MADEIPYPYVPLYTLPPDQREGQRTKMQHYYAVRRFRIKQARENGESLRSISLRWDISTERVRQIANG